MIVVETSAILAIRFLEAERATFLDVLNAADELLVPASCALEASMAIRRKGEDAAWVDIFLESGRLRIASIDAEVAQIARLADRSYGRGTGHPARLNFGDCLAYAVAKSLDAPLLYKSDDFIHTDVRSAL